ncbi:MAG: hypothetical protein K0Q64_1121 [Nitrobacter vulgaris]|nr:hypothetical protein [Nitrobacter vulgaris]
MGDGISCAALCRRHEEPAKHLNGAYRAYPGAPKLDGNFSSPKDIDMPRQRPGLIASRNEPAPRPASLPNRYTPCVCCEVRWITVPVARNTPDFGSRRSAPTGILSRSKTNGSGSIATNLTSADISSALGSFIESNDRIFPWFAPPTSSIASTPPAVEVKTVRTPTNVLPS